MDQIAILLKTFKDDLAYVDRLIKSYNKYNQDNIPLHLVAPQQDLVYFKKISNGNINFHSDESVTKDLVSDNRVRGIRPGYINQEIIKLAFWEKRLCKNYFCMDSDGVFIRNFFKSDFMYNHTVPYTILVEDKELAVDPEYYKTHWKGREKLIRKIQEEIGLTDKRMLTCHAFAIFSCKVLEPFYQNYLTLNNYTYKDILKISPYEFSWYNMWLQKDKTIPVEFKEPLIKFFHNQTQHQDYIRKKIKIKDIARGYIGININSNYSRGYGVVSYQDGDIYVMTSSDIITSLKKIIQSIRIHIKRKLTSYAKIQPLIKKIKKFSINNSHASGDKI